MIKTDQPKTANEVLTATRDDHNWSRTEVDINTTGGIQRAIKAQWHAIQALADYIDGVATGTTNDDGAPIKSKQVENAAKTKADAKVTYSAAHEPLAAPPHVSPSYQERPAPVL
jgi:hypothetical protein